MDFEQLRIFLALADEGTFLGAANQLATSRSRVRRKLEQLEHAAGTALLRREAAGLVLTPAGRVLKRRGRHLLEEADLLITHVHEVGVEPQGAIKCALPIGPPPSAWELIRAQMQKAFPAVGMELFFAEEPCSLLPNRAEVAWTFDEQIPIDCHGFEVGCYPMQLLASEAYRSEQSLPQSISDLDRHRLGVWRPALTLPESRMLRSGGEIAVRGHFLSDDAASLVKLAAAGECLAFVPVLPEYIEPGLMTVLTDEIVGCVRLYVVVPDVLADIPRVREFVGLAHQGLAAMH